jgi:hypothetical protein
MIKRIFVLSFFIASFANFSFAQILPEKFKINTLPKGLSKISAATSLTPGGNGVSDILIIGDTIWVSNNKGLSRSTDYGSNWANYYMTDVFGSEGVSALGYHNGTIWVATCHSITSSGEVIPVGSGLRYSSDNGSTWKTLPQPVDASGDSALVYGINDGVRAKKVRALPVTVNEQNIIYDIAFTSSAIWVATYSGGIRKSTDNGASWQRVLLPSDNINHISPTDTISYSLQPVFGTFGTENYLNHRGFSVIAVNDSIIFAGTAGGINKSTDGGISWQKFTHTNQTHPISGNFIVAMAFNKVNNSLWAATWSANSDESYGVSYSTDLGDTWTVTLDGEQAHNFGFKDYQVIAVTNNSAFRTQNLGASWIGPNSIIDNTTKTSIASTIFYAAASSGKDVWLGNNEGLAKITENSIWSGEWKIFFASQQLTSKTATYAYPNPFSPRSDRVKIKYSTNNKTQNVTIRILDFGMNLVKTVIQNAARGSQIHQISQEDGGVIDYWDGKDEKGNIVPNGVYFYRVDVGSDDPVFGKILVLQ